MFKNKFNALNDRSKQILSVFTKTVSDLILLNEDLDTESDIRKAEADRFDVLRAEELVKASALQANKEYNEKVIAKITSFLED
jgi:fructose-1,6-bisphosphatase